MPPSAAESAKLWEPVRIGPSWQRDPVTGKFVLPERTLGWQQLVWTAAYMQKAGKPWKYTAEQARLTLWWYGVDENGEFLFDWGVIQRLKGWGKDPLVATWCGIELVGPSRLDGFATKDGAIRYGQHTFRYRKGDPIAKPHPEAWIQVAAVSKEQTKNTMRCFPSLFNPAAVERYQLDIGKEIVYAHKGAQMIEAVTSSPRAIEGGRASKIVQNETHHWLANNSGHDMADTIGNNSDKAPAGLPSRRISITNAYEPSEDSIAQQEREAYESIQAGTSLGSRVMYDSLEAPPEAPLTAEAAPAVIEAVRGDATWLDVPRIVRSILSPRSRPSRSRRMWFNQIVAAEDAWIVPQDFDLCRAPELVVADREDLAVFFDGSKSDDATAIAGCRVSDGHVLTLGMWQRPPGERGKLWTVPRPEVDARMEAIVEQYNVVALFGDPSHVKDDETQERYWDDLLDSWHRRWRDQLQVWAVPGKGGHSVMWDMTSSARQQEFTAAAERCVSDIETSARAARAGKFGERVLTWDGDGRMRTHAHNARRYPTRYGVSLWKGHRESARKIDLAVCMVGARMVRRAFLNAGLEKKRSGRVV